MDESPTPALTWDSWSRRIIYQLERTESDRDELWQENRRLWDEITNLTGRLTALEAGNIQRHADEKVERIQEDHKAETDITAIKTELKWMARIQGTLGGGGGAAIIEAALYVARLAMH